MENPSDNDTASQSASTVLESRHALKLPLVDKEDH
jgi:hypothetical protein